jgi:DNA-binding transcriptional LysR family regulator
MRRDDLGDLLAFVSVARERSFTKAAARLGVSQSALSHTVTGLEARLGVRLLTRTTRSVSPTEAGENLLQRIGPHFEEIEAGLAALREMRDKPAGTIRITADEYSAETILWPTLREFLPRYPDIKVEVSADNSFTDIAAKRFDAGVRLGEALAPGMIATPIGPKVRWVVVGAPSYFTRHARPKAPKDLMQHDCINVRMETHGALYAWEFEKGQRKLNVKVEGRLVFNKLPLIVDAAVAGLGLAFVFEGMVEKHIKDGRLEKVLDDWCPPFSGYHLYYPSRRYSSPAFALLVEALRYRE